jgi:hypothetical protein
MKKLHIQKSITWCDKHDISCVKLYSSNNIFLSNIYDDGTSISSFKNNNNAFLKGKYSNFTNNVYTSGGVGGTYNKNKSITLLPESPRQPKSLVNEVMSSETIETNETNETNENNKTNENSDTIETIVNIDTNNTE